MVNSLIEMLLALVKDRVGTMLKEILDRILEALENGELVELEEWIETLPPFAKLIAMQVYDFVKKLLELVKEEFEKEIDPV